MGVSIGLRQSTATQHFIVQLVWAYERETIKPNLATQSLSLRPKAQKNEMKRTDKSKKLYSFGMSHSLPHCVCLCFSKK